MNNAPTSRHRTRPAGPRILLAFAAGLLALLGSCHRGGPPRNVVLISVDTMRADRMGLTGYPRATTPNLDRWFGEHGRVYRRSYSTEASTTPSVISMLTGLLPQQHRVRMLIQLVPPELPLLCDLLPEPWQSAGFVSNMMLTSEASGIGPHFDHYDDFVDERELYREDTFERTAARTTDAVLEWIGKGFQSDKPLFLWVHYMDPHGPYHAPDSWPRRFHHDASLPIDVTRILAYQREPGVDDGLAYVDAYDEEIAYTDAEIGRLLEGLDDKIDLDRTLVVFTADHGESLMDHELWFRHAVQVYDEMVRVPLMLRGPGVVPGIFDELTSGIDVTPTVLTALGLPLGPLMPKVDLRNGKGLSASRAVFTEASLSARDGAEQWRAAISGTTKWMIGVRAGNCESTMRCYDLGRDPEELNVLPWNADADTPDALLTLCRDDPDPAGVPKAWAFGQGLQGPKWAPPSAEGEMSAEEKLKKLKALGYAE